MQSSAPIAGARLSCLVCVTPPRVREIRGRGRAQRAREKVLGYWYNLICLFTNSCVCGPSLYDAATYNMTCYE